MAKAARGFFLWGTVEMGRAGGGAVWKQQTKQAWADSGVAARDDLLGRGTKPRAGRAKRLPDAVAKLCFRVETEPSEPPWGEASLQDAGHTDIHTRGAPTLV